MCVSTITTLFVLFVVKKFQDRTFSSPSEQKRFLLIIKVNNVKIAHQKCFSFSFEFPSAVNSLSVLFHSSKKKKKKCHLLYYNKAKAAPRLQLLSTSTSFAKPSLPTIQEQANFPSATSAPPSNKWQSIQQKKHSSNYCINQRMGLY